MYIDHYGLSGPPFQLTPDARFWFDSRTHRKAMAYLGYGLAQEEGFIAITGEIGAGKSTLAAHLLAKIDRARLTTVEIVSTQVEGDDMLRLVAQGLGIDTDGTAKALLLERVEQALEDEYRGGKRTLIIVDEAQNLPTSALEELRMLSNFHLAGRALVQIVLLGQPEFREKIADPGLEQLRQRVIAIHHLEAMGADEIEAYVRHRLRLVGWSGTPDFTADAYQSLFEATDGVPRRLNQLLNRLLLHGAVERLNTFDGEAVETVAAELDFGRRDIDVQPVPARQDPVAADEAPQDQPAEQAEIEPPFQVPSWVAEQPAVQEEEMVEQEPQPFTEPAEPVTHAADPEPVPEAVEPTEQASEPWSEPDEPAYTPQPVAFDAAGAERIASLEARLEEQETTIRRVLTLMVEWAERDQAEWDRQAERRSGIDRRIRAV